jgi:hypothetical protein
MSRLHDKIPSRFKVGERVRVTGGTLEYAGRTGIITNTYQLAAADSERDACRYVVFFIEDGTDAVFYDFELDSAFS